MLPRYLFVTYQVIVKTVLCLHQRMKTNMHNWLLLAELLNMELIISHRLMTSYQGRALEKDQSFLINEKQKNFKYHPSQFNLLVLMHPLQLTKSCFIQLIIFDIFLPLKLLRKSQNKPRCILHKQNQKNQAKCQPVTLRNFLAFAFTCH